MIWADRVAVVWGGLMALVVWWLFGRTVAPVNLNEVFLVWLILSAGPWVLLRALRWAFVSGR